ncbi:hypothetical protein BABINDRAFT_166324 [Babjeviella inositovora NRRL Y-12698]|uniref:NADPH--cytochrome P450 reductase n=1 Tax=Babjeviella inositovora NRRL Y-12698 TaxID=984486 RepID=A0A1E3QSP4_9ASCO|nr:uncharacterized protein BABINDRAFT_166324 [Babjeviella inositovora NRRL Y-12698]ODQ80733.1 hypothetical protein BABINDRAFT_166324 [Babjeviella inositovora NRRL Y-12698]
MSLDTLDHAVLLSIVLALITYVSKGKLWGVTSAPATSTGSRDIAEVLSASGKRCIVFHGSQTGTAEDYASKFAKELQSRFGIPSMTADLEKYDFDSLPALENKLVFFFMATYGEGEPTDNAIEFMEWLNSADDLAAVKFGVFGLGNSTYEFYNAIGRKVQAKIAELNGQFLGPYGEGDDGRGTMDEDFLSWKDAMFASLKDQLDVEEHAMQYQPALEVVELDAADPSTVFLGEPSRKYLDPSQDLSLGPFNHSHPYLAPIASTYELFSLASRSCIHAEFDLSDSNLRYSTGDHLAIWPSNSDAHVSKFLAIFGWEDKRNQVIDIRLLDQTASVPFPTPTTYETVVRHYLGITGPLSRQSLSAIAAFAPTDASKLLAMALGGNKDAFKEKIHDRYMDIADALAYISGGATWEVPFSFVIETTHSLQPRYYSISSSSLSEKRSIHVTAVVEADTPAGSDHLVTGVTTNLLRHIQLTQNQSSQDPHQRYNLSGPRGKLARFKLPVHVRRSTFKLPTNPASPVIMIGPGSGVAPFRGFVRDKVHRKTQNPNEKQGKIMLFYGCRSAEEDFLYKEEWPQYASKLGESFEMITAFSRETTRKVYVQHRIMERAEEIADLLGKGAFIYVCGDASRMARDVHDALAEVLVASKKMTREMAVDMLRNFKIQNRYQEDIW